MVRGIVKQNIYLLFDLNSFLLIICICDHTRFLSYYQIHQANGNLLEGCEFAFEKHSIATNANVVKQAGWYFYLSFSVYNNQ